MTSVAVAVPLPDVLGTVLLGFHVFSSSVHFSRLPPPLPAWLLLQSLPFVTFGFSLACCRG